MQTTTTTTTCGLPRSRARDGGYRVSTSANRNEGFLLLLLLLRFFSFLSKKNFFQIDFSKNSHKIFHCLVSLFLSSSSLFQTKADFICNLPKKERKREIFSKKKKKKKKKIFTSLHSFARALFCDAAQKNTHQKRENAKKRERNANRGHESHAFAVASRVRLYRGVHLFLSPHFFFF